MLLVGSEREGSTCGGGGGTSWGSPCPGSGTEQGQRMETCFGVSHGPEGPSPSVCVSQKPHHPEGSSEPLGDLSSHPLPPCVSSCRSCVSLDPLATNSMLAKHSSVLTDMHVPSPSELKRQPHNQITLMSAGSCCGAHEPEHSGQPGCR